MVTYKLDIDDRGRAHKSYSCISTDVTPDDRGGYSIQDTEDAKNADTAYEMDTSVAYLYDEENAHWLKQ